MTDPLGLARGYLDTGRADRAMEVLGPELVARPEDPEVLRLAALALLTDGDPREARTLAARAVAARPADPALHVLVSRASSAIGRHRAAAREADEAVRLGPGRWDAHAAVVLAAIRAKRIDRRVLASASELHRLAPGNPGVLSLLGWMEVVRRDRNAARSLFESALELDPTLVDARNGLAHLEVRSIVGAGRAAVSAMDVLGDAPTDRGAQALLRVAGHRATWLLCLGPMIVAGISARVLDAQVHLGSTTAGPVLRTEPFLAVLVAALAPALAIWVAHMRRTTEGRLGVLLRIVPAMRPELAVWAGCSAIAALLCAVALWQPPGTAYGIDSIAAPLALLPGFACLLLERRRRARGRRA